MRRLVVDANVYIDWFNAGLHEEILFQRDTVKHLSAVVILELEAGAFTASDRRLVQRVERSFRKAGRILVPSLGAFSEAGNVLRRLQAEHGYQVKGNHAIVADVLIAMSARSIGATVATQNGRDFRAIQAVRPFQLLVIE